MWPTRRTDAPSPTSEAPALLAVVDQALAGLGERDLIPRTHAVDVLLDLRLAISEIDELDRALAGGSASVAR